MKHHPQTTANTPRFWSFGNPIVRRNTTRHKANTFSFYALNGTYVVDFEKNSKEESICIFIEKIRANNPGKHIVVILDNFTYLPVYSHHLNPIGYSV